MSRSKTIIDRKKLNDLIREKGGSRRIFEQLRQDLEDFDALDRLARSGYSGLTQNRLLYGSDRKEGDDGNYTPFFLIESIFLSRILDVTLAEIVDQQHAEVFSGTGIDTYARTVRFDDVENESQSEDLAEEQLVRYFIEKEKGERIVVVQEFPSALYIDNKLQAERYEKLLRSTSTSTEYYPLRSMLNFVLSPVTRFGCVEKQGILDRMLRMLNEGHRHIYFFDHSQDSFPGNFASMNIVNREDLLIFLISVPNMVLEVRNPDMLRSILTYFRSRQNKQLLSSLTSEMLIEIAMNAISNNKNGKNIDPQSFLTLCDQSGINSSEIQIIADQFA